MIFNFPEDAEGGNKKSKIDILTAQKCYFCPLKVNDMKQNGILYFLMILISVSGFGQNDIPEEKLEEVVITSSRIDLPFTENSRTITVISSEDIKHSAATNVADVLQQFAGIDIRRRGTNGTQADLYIRGGGFDQTLLLIDGIKLEDAQTGHHTLNLALPIEVIERIEIIKGPAARVFGQNAFTGAINIVTKKSPDNITSLGLQAGSYGQVNGSATLGLDLGGSSHIIHYSRNTSDGYRINSDYDNQNYFIKSTFNKNRSPIQMIASFSDRDFGAQNFYTTNETFSEYEETEGSLLSFQTRMSKGNLTIKPQVYWRRNQDMFLLRRDDPGFYRNFHITNKVGMDVNASYTSKLGVTGFGVDVAKVYISSNNLGQRDRFMANLFAEHRFSLLGDKLDITPGIAVNYFSDFKFHAFPGMDVGYRFNEAVKLYGNIGYTYRIPTYTDLYYSDPATLGNPDLEPEEAIAEELGLKYSVNDLEFNIAFFNRDSKKIIDYVKENEGDLFQATNIRDLNTKGFETSASYSFKIKDFRQVVRASYTFIDDEVKDLNLDFSRYSINSLKHHFAATYQSQFFKNLTQSLVYKYAERTVGQSYNVVDASVTWSIKSIEATVIANNIFNADYIETGFVPMPKGNVIFGLRYNF